MKGVVLSLLLTVTTLAGWSIRADEFASWEWIAPKPAGNKLTKVVFDGTRFVGVGDMGVILTSTNGTNWHLAYTDTTNRLFGITAGGGWLVGYGNYGTVLASRDAAVWSNCVLAATGPVMALAYGQQRYVALPLNDPLHVSHHDPFHLQPVNTLPAFGALDLEFGDDLFVAVGWRGTIFTSTNALDWVQRESGTIGPIWSVAYGNGTWVAVGAEGTTGFILTSPDGLSWFLQLTDKPMNDVTYGPDGFVAVGGGFMGSGVSMTSSDGTYFSGGEPGDSGLDAPPTGVACGNGVCVAVGDPGRIWTTEDGGSNWVSQTSGPLAIINGFASDGDKLVAAGAGGTILVSTDGQNFDDRSVSTDEHFLDVVYTGTRFVAVGGGGVVRTSVDGEIWQLEDTGTNATFRAVAHGQGRTVVIGWDVTQPPYGLFAVREETGQWQVVRPAENEYLFWQIAFGNGRFVAGGYDGEIWTSENGLQWIKHDLGIGLTIYLIQFIEGRFVAFTRGLIGFSNDGINWTFSPGNPPLTNRLVFGNDLYLSPSMRSPADYPYGTVHVSSDAVNWRQIHVKSLDFGAAAYFKDSFYISGYILKSASSLVPQFERKVFLPDLVLFDLFGKVGRDYELQSSGDLVNWEIEEEYHQATRIHTVTRPAAPDQRFYRVKLKEP